MSIEPRDLLGDILDELEFLESVRERSDARTLAGDPVLQRAVARSLEVIGEASKRLPDSFRSEHPEIDWRGMAGLRDRLIHAYFGIDWVIVSEVVREKTPELKTHLARIRKSRPESPGDGS